MDLTTFKSSIAAIDARILQLQNTKAIAIESALSDVPVGLRSDRFAEEVGRPYDSEVDWLRRERDILCINYARSLL